MNDRLKIEPEFILWAGLAAIVALHLFWEPETISALGRTFRRLIPVFFAIWFLRGAFENPAEQVPKWVRALAVVISVLLVSWTLFFWGTFEDDLLRWFFKSH
jgi:hypothetical protein